MSNNRKQLRVTLPEDMGELFSKHKAATEFSIMADLTDAQYSKMLITQALKTLEKQSS